MNTQLGGYALVMLGTAVMSVALTSILTPSQTLVAEDEYLQQRVNDMQSQNYELAVQMEELLHRVESAEKCALRLRAMKDRLTEAHDLEKKYHDLEQDLLRLRQDEEEEEVAT